jgi:phosphate transport system substrate-binding protein
MVKQTDGAIGYVEYGYALKSDIAMAVLENKSGNFTAPTIESAQAALSGMAAPPSDLRIWLPDPESPDAYPIVSYTWLLCYETYDDPIKLAALKEAIRYCLTEGQRYSGELGYVPLPESIRSLALAELDALKAAR